MSNTAIVQRLTHTSWCESSVHPVISIPRKGLDYYRREVTDTFPTVFRLRGSSGRAARDSRAPVTPA